MKPIKTLISSLLFIGSVFLSVSTNAQSARSINSESTSTIIFLVRHAEKISDGSKDPNLSELGNERVQKLSNKLSNINFSKVFSTNYKRTINTVKPIATQNEIDVEIYDFNNVKSFLENIIVENRGRNVLISGHSNTVPQFTNLLLGKEYFEGNFGHDEYDNLIIIITEEIGKGRLIHLMQ